MLIIPTLGAGGAERLCIDLARHINKDAFSVTVVSLYSEKYASTVFDKDREDHSFQIRFLSKKLGFDWQTLQKLRALIKQERPDVIHSHIGAGIYAALSMGIGYKPLRLHTVHSLAEKEMPKVHRTVMYFAYKMGLKPVAISKTVQASIQKLYHLQEGQVFLVNNGIQLERFVQIGRQKPMATINIISIGRMDRQKNHGLLLSAFAVLLQSVPQCRLTILGDGELRNELIEMAEKLNILQFVSLPGVVNDVAVYLSQSHIFALSSDYEGFGLVIAEAMACGLPVVSTLNGGAENIITDGVDGFLTPIGDVQSLADRLRELALSEKLRDRLGSKARETANRFDLNVMVAQYERLYDLSSRYI